jgi:hypothetical protein
LHLRIVPRGTTTRGTEHSSSEAIVPRGTLEAAKLENAENTGVNSTCANLQRANAHTKTVIAAKSYSVTPLLLIWFRALINAARGWIQRTARKLS